MWPSPTQREAMTVAGKRRQWLFFLLLYLFLLLIMQPIHCAHNGPPEWMNATVLFMTQYPFREGKKIEQRGEKCRTPVTISAPVSEVTLLSRTFSLSLSLGVFTLQWAWVLLRSSCVCLPLVRSTELDSTFPSGWQPAAVCVCSSCEKVATGEKHGHVRTAVGKLMKHGL